MQNQTAEYYMRVTKEILSAKWARAQPSSQVMMIGPDIASEMLAASLGNRPVRAWHIKDLAAVMRRGEWRLTHQGVAFDTTGVLRDGHHRLRAIVSSGLSIPVVVAMGIDAEAFDAVDQGVRRTVADLMGEDKRIAEPIKAAAAIIFGTRASMPQIEIVAQTGLRDELHKLIAFCGGAAKYYSSASMRLAACLSVMYGEDRGFVHGQYRALCTLSFADMTVASQALAKQVGKAGGVMGSAWARDSLARGMRVFRQDMANSSRVQVYPGDLESVLTLVRGLVRGK